MSIIKSVSQDVTLLLKYYFTKVPRLSPIVVLYLNHDS